MRGLQLNTFDREAAEASPAARDFVTSYLWMRMAIGLLGVTLPVLLVLVDWWFVATPQPIRGSMSAYYHSSARDVFVGGLAAIGLFLITYMSAKRRTYDYVLSTLGGVLVIVVALLPTARAGSALGISDFEPRADSCAVHVGPPPCNGFEDKWGEDTVRTIHQVAASAFVVTLVLLCVVFALREFGYGPNAKKLVGAALGVNAVREALGARGVSVARYLWKGLPAPKTDPAGKAHEAPRRRTLTYLGGACAIVISALWAKLGPDVALPFVTGEVGSTYLGEFGAFVSFGIVWLAASWDLMPTRIRTIGESAADVVDTISGTESSPPEDDATT